MSRRAVGPRALLAPCCLLAALLLLPTPAVAADNRELAAEREAFVEVEVAGVGITPAGVPAVLLRRPGAEEAIPIFIGTGQARSIARALQGAEPPRPMTHDLLNNTLGVLEARVARVFVDDVRDSTFYGMIELKAPDREEPVRVDSRPSDALALALRADAPVAVSPQVLEAARELDYEGMEERVAKAAGITVNPLSTDLREALGLPEREGVVVSQVTGPAREAGLRAGDLITEVNGETPKGPTAFRRLIRDTPKGQSASIQYWQEGESHRIEVPSDLPEERRTGGSVSPA